MLTFISKNLENNNENIIISIISIIPLLQIVRRRQFVVSVINYMPLFVPRLRGPL